MVIRQGRKGGGAVPAYPKHLITQREETLVVVAQVAGLGGAARSAVLGIEVKYKFLSGEIAQPDKVPVFVMPFKIWGFCSFLQHGKFGFIGL